jgi:signal transducing adaptor molecule
MKKKIDRLFHLLSEANPEDPSQDTEEMLILENQVNQMGPLIDAELERVDRKHAQLTQLSSELVDAINLYHTLMRESDRPMANMPFMGYGPHPNMYGMYQPMPNMFLPQPGQIPANNFPPLPGMMLPQQTMNMAGMPMQQFHGMQMINNQPPQQQSQPPQQGIVPQPLQNGHMNIPNNQLPPQQQQQPQNNPPQIIHNIGQQIPSQQPPTSAPLNHAPHPGNLVQPPQQNPSHNFNPSTDFQQHPINQINMAGPMANMQPQQQRTNLSNNNPIPMPMQQIHHSQQTQLQSPHLMQQMSGASPVHLPPSHMISTNMHYGAIQTILPTSDSNTSIPIYQQQR